MSTENTNKGLTPEEQKTYEKLEQSFMTPSITNMKCYVVDGSHGIELIPFDCVGKVDLDCDDPEENVYPQFTYNYSGDISNVELEEGYYAQLSAPGFMDQTELSGPFETETEAMRHLIEMYGDDE